MNHTSSTIVIEATNVFPSTKYGRPPVPAQIPLHSLDLLVPGIHIRNHRFYRPTRVPFEELCRKLRETLAEALELYPPVSGIIRVGEKGEVYVSMDGQGTPFSAEKLNVPYDGDYEGLSARTGLLLDPGSPSLAAKITQFSCGTIAVATSMHHQLCDLRGFLDFLETWARLARGEPVDFELIPDDWMHTPAQFFPTIPSSEALTKSVPGFIVLDRASAGFHEFMGVPAAATRWRFNKSAMDQMKHDFSPTDVTMGWISSGDALAALVCGVITRAREAGNVPRLGGRSDVHEGTERFTMAADGRERSPNKAMANGKYFGNFNPLFSSTVARSDLLSVSNSSASRVALEIRKTINRQLSPEALVDKLTFFEAPANAIPPGRIIFVGDIIMTNWCRFDLQGPLLDMGWGKPFEATAGSGTPIPPGYVVLTQDKETGDVFVTLGVETQGGLAVNNDEVLLRYGELVEEL